MARYRGMIPLIIGRVCQGGPDLSGSSLFLMKADTRKGYGGYLPLEMCCSTRRPQDWKACLE